MDAVITVLDVVTSENGKCHVVVGNMQIVCGKSPPSETFVIVRMLRDYLESWVGEPNIPVVRMMLGDNNLVSIDARDALQRVTELDPHWRSTPPWWRVPASMWRSVEPLRASRSSLLARRSMTVA